MSIFFYSVLILYLVGSGLCLRKVKSLRAEGFNEITFLQCLNPILWFSLVIGKVFKVLVPPHIFEQYVLRVYDEECRPQCYLSRNGTCVECGCDALAKAYSPISQCSKGNWGRIIFNKSKYKKLRDDYPVQIKINYGILS